MVENTSIRPHSGNSPSGGNNGNCKRCASDHEDRRIHLEVLDHYITLLDWVLPCPPQPNISSRIWRWFRVKLDHLSEPDSYSNRPRTAHPPPGGP